MGYKRAEDILPKDEILKMELNEVREEALICKLNAKQIDKRSRYDKIKKNCDT